MAGGSEEQNSHRKEGTMWASNTHPGMNVVAELIRVKSSDHLGYYIIRESGCRRTVGVNWLMSLKPGNPQLLHLRKKGNNVE